MRSYELLPEQTDLTDEFAGVRSIRASQLNRLFPTVLVAQLSCN